MPEPERRPRSYIEKLEDRIIELEKIIKEIQEKLDFVIV
jgi:hypothetical protein